MVKNKISCAYVEIIKHQQTNNRTNSPLPMAGSSLPLNEHPAACGWRWELGGEHSWHVGVWGALAISGTGDGGAVKTDTQELLRACWRAAPPTHSIQRSTLICTNQRLQQLFRQVIAHKGSSLLCVWAKSPWVCGGRRGALQKLVQRGTSRWCESFTSLKL